MGYFCKSVQKVHLANTSEKLSIAPPSKPQTEPQGEKHLFHRFLQKKEDVGCSLSDADTRIWDCLQARHVLCLQGRHLLPLQPRSLFCQGTRHLWSPKTSQQLCEDSRSVAVLAMELGCLGRPQMSCLLTQQMWPSRVNVTAWPSLVLAWLGLLVAWPGLLWCGLACYGVAWPCYSVAWPCHSGAWLVMAWPGLLQNVWRELAWVWRGLAWVWRGLT